MSSLPNKGERTRQAILEAAYSLFIEQGYHATSMRQIARRAEVALGGIYNHFESKEQIFDQVLVEKHPYRQVLAILQTAPGDSVEEFARNAARAVVSELGRRPDFLKLAFIELSEFKGAHAARLFHTVFPHFIPLLQRFNHPHSQLRELPPQVILLSFYRRGRDPGTMILLFDIGNTNTHLGLANEQRLLGQTNLPTQGWFDRSLGAMVYAFAKGFKVKGIMIARSKSSVTRLALDIHSNTAT